jgi:hypothetical protein
MPGWKTRVLGAANAPQYFHQLVVVFADELLRIGAVETDRRHPK